MRIDFYHNVYFIGIGGIGMSALARWFHQNSFDVAGYDRTPTRLSQQMESEGIPIHYEDSPDLIPQKFLSNTERLLVIYTPAVPESHRELRYLQSLGCTIQKRSQVLGKITEGMYTVAVAGTHGKTTTSSMIAHLLKEGDKDIVAFLGGLSANFQGNFVPNTGDLNRAVAVVEADEYDRSFLTLHPNIAVVTSADPDHLDIYGDDASMKQSFRDFINQIHHSGHLFIQEKIARDLVPDNFKPNVRTYGLNQGQFFAENITIENGFFLFDYADEDTRIRGIRLGVSGFHNVENATAAIAVALALGVNENVVKTGLENYKGVSRRFEFILRENEKVLVDDYAHHPAEISAFLNSLKALYPKEKITVIFQPHLFTRTRDFVEGFAESLSLADRVILLPIYPAREEPLEGVTSKIIYDLITTEKYLTEKDELIKLLKTLSPQVMATIGAGDIDRMVEPVKKFMEAAK
jgi:UDP-N-acetylmuramate--alanine ligase